LLPGSSLPLTAPAQRSAAISDSCWRGASEFPIFAVGGYLEALASPDLDEDQRQKYAVKGLMNLQRLNSLDTLGVVLYKRIFFHFSNINQTRV
jgi:hypothetical protein